MKVMYVYKGLIYVAQSGGQYRINLPKDVIKSKLLDPQKKAVYWIYFVEEVNDS